MKRTVSFDGNTISYDLIYKNVKNINLRIKTDGSVTVSANPFVSIGVIEGFIASKKDFILSGILKYQNKPTPVKHREETELKRLVLDICRRIYPYYEKRGVKYPVIKFRKMTSSWGNCRSARGILTFNTNLVYAPEECVEYVVYHEFTHFLQPNHSKLFYEELAVVCPGWKVCKNRLKEIIF